MAGFGLSASCDWVAPGEMSEKTLQTAGYFADRIIGIIKQVKKNSHPSNPFYRRQGNIASRDLI